MKFVPRTTTDKTQPQVRRWSTFPASHKDEAAIVPRAAARRRRRIADDEIAELILEGKDVPEEMLRKALRKGTLEGKFTPVHCGSSKNSTACSFCSTRSWTTCRRPLDRPPVEGIVPEDEGERSSASRTRSEPFSGLAFKTVTEATGDLVFVRIYSGELQPGRHGT